jgi:superfamily II DNA or RNA helicase
VSTQLRLRDYQSECVGAVWNAWAGNTQRPAVVLPTGSGKTVIFAHLVQEFVTLGRATSTPYRVVILVHRDELADQAIDKIRSLAPGVSVGKVKAADNDVYADVMVCSVQTLARPRRLQQLMAQAPATIGLVVIDEAHHAAADSYRRIMGELGCFSGLRDGIGTRTVGFTATLKRGDGVGLGDVWENVVFTRSVLWMISRGYLTDVRGIGVDLAALNLSSVKKSGGDYQARDLGKAIMEADGPRVVARAIQVHASARRPIVFLPDVASAHATSEAMAAAGISNAVVDGGTGREDRLEIYRRYRTGELQSIVNCMVLTEGADFPWADCAVIARPTANPPLYIQMVGRVLRPWPGKTDALVMDLTGQEGGGGKLATLIDLAPGEVSRLGQGESLADAAVRTEKEANRVVRAGSVAFDLRVRHLDMFSASGHAWLRTAAGVMFIPVGNEEIFLWPDGDGGWDVRLGSGRKKWPALHTGLPLGTAMAWAETEAEDREPFNIAKSADWRRRKAEPRQIVTARSYGVPIGDDPRKGELSDGISIARASGKYDPYIRRTEKRS